MSAWAVAHGIGILSSLCWVSHSHSIISVVICFLYLSTCTYVVSGWGCCYGDFLFIVVLSPTIHHIINHCHSPSPLILNPVVSLCISTQSLHCEQLLTGVEAGIFIIVMQVLRQSVVVEGPWCSLGTLSIIESSFPHCEQRLAAVGLSGGSGELNSK